MSGIEQWLRDHGLVQLKEVFEREQIDLDALRVLTEANLRDLGLPMGPRAKLLAAIQTLKDSGAAPGPNASTVLAVTHEPVSFVAGDRRQLSVMFCDLVGSTELSRRLDPEELRALIRRYQDLCVGAISRFEGYVAQYLGDGVLAYFGYPVALEAAAERAIRAALAILERVAESGTREHPLQVRIGIDTGLVVIGRGGAGDEKERTAIGDAPNVAARVQSLAAPGHVVISERTRTLAPGAFLYRDLGAHVLKGLDQPLRVWQVDGESSSETRFDAVAGVTPAPMVGREVEFEAALQTWRKAKAGKGQVLLLSGEPGIGKSRILRALLEKLAAEEVAVWQYQCSLHFVNSALYPIIQHFEHTLRFKRGESPEQKLDRLALFLTETRAMTPHAVNLIGRLFNLPAETRYGVLAMTPQKQKDETLRVLAEIIVKAAQKTPLVMLFEDLHWADPTTLEALEVLLRRIAQLPILILMSYRQEFHAPWAGQASVTALTLARLDPEQTLAVVKRVAGGKRLPDAILRHITAKTDGVPLFVEELTKAILESGQLTEEADHYSLSGSLSALAIPSTLRDSLMARLDRLVSVKEVAQTGACVGREFSFELLAMLVPLSKSQLDEALEKLVQAELVFRRGSGGGAVYVFKHALIQDASYDSLLKSQRAQLHANIAKALEERFPETKDSDPEIFAHHYTEAGMAEQASAYWLLAGRASFGSAAVTEAVRQLRSGMEQVQALPKGPIRDRRELDIQMLLGQALIQTKGLAAPEADMVLKRAYDLRGVLLNSAELVPILWGIFVVRLIVGQPRAAIEIAQELLSNAQGEHDAELVARTSLMDAHFWLGDFEISQGYFDEAIALYDDASDVRLMANYSFDMKITNLIYASHFQWILGYPERSLQTKKLVDAWAQRLDHPFMYAFAYTWGTGPLHYRGDIEEHRLQVEKGLQVSREIGFPHFEGQAELWCAWNRASRGDLSEDNLALFESAITHFAGTGSGILVPYFRALQAQALASRGEISKALGVLQAALELVDTLGERSHAAEIHRIRAGVLRNEPSATLDQAEYAYKTALEIARQQHAKSWELRTAISYAHLMRDQGRMHEARELLKPIYDWFTEGFDTEDLKSAKALLHELERG